MINNHIIWKIGCYCVCITHKSYQESHYEHLMIKMVLKIILQKAKRLNIGIDAACIVTYLTPLVTFFSRKGEEESKESL